MKLDVFDSCRGLWDFYTVEFGRQEHAACSFRTGHQKNPIWTQPLCNSHLLTHCSKHLEIILNMYEYLWTTGWCVCASLNLVDFFKNCVTLGTDFYPTSLQFRESHIGKCCGIRKPTEQFFKSSLTIRSSDKTVSDDRNCLGIIGHLLQSARCGVGKSKVFFRITP